MDPTGSCIRLHYVHIGIGISIGIIIGISIGIGIDIMYILWNAHKRSKPAYLASYFLLNL